MPSQDEFNQIMEEAEAAAWRNSHNFTSRLQTSARFTGRKMMRKSPTMAIRFLAGRVPLVGSVLSFGVDKISAKIRQKRLKAGVFKAEGESASAVNAKFMSKSLSELATKIDSNITKQKAAYQELDAALRKLNQADSGSGEISCQDWLNAFKAAAYAYYRVDHYNLKIAELVDLGESRMENLGKWAEAGTDLLVSGKDELWKVFDERHDSLTDSDLRLLGAGRVRSSSSSSL
ncbi:hypothetical protein [Bryobacter aggregatus]|uniref:hypothetical protein n=1 Tax=Bryobacter aggregatus TaxID=360054 RepID=UPI0004E1D851|nr:hypothetical protein [Bryobacter aggregatus]